MWEIRQEARSDELHIDALAEHSFGPGRFVKTVYRLREGVDPDRDLGFVAIEDGILRGSVRFWPICIGTATSLMLGPLAVQSDQRGRGIGIALMSRGIEEARARGHRAIVLVGDLPYYARVGFAAVTRGRIKFPGPVDAARVLGLALAIGGLDTLEGPVRRARLDNPVCADGAALGASD
jgi:predicted N-acetyltransferase YhbS